jgi:molybdate transport system regulatory protein
MNMSYKAAWDTIDIMNNVSEHPLVVRVKGGKGGGGTHLTPYARELIQTYAILQEEHQVFLQNLSKRLHDHDGHCKLLKSIDVRISARNQLLANVIEIRKGSVESEVFLTHKNSNTFMAIITNDSLQMMELEVGTKVHALFKANALTITTDTSVQRSDRNRFDGVVERISIGSFDAEVVIGLDSSDTICSTMSLELLQELKLKPQMEVSAFCKPNSIILGIW